MYDGRSYTYSVDFVDLKKIKVVVVDAFMKSKLYVLRVFRSSLDLIVEIGAITCILFIFSFLFGL